MATVRARRALVALVLATAAAPAFAVDFGTLFTSPEERTRLDRLRRGEPEAATAAAIVQSADPRVTGYVRRSDGLNTVWIDGRPVVVSGAEAERALQSAPMAAPPVPDGSIKVEKRPKR